MVRVIENIQSPPEGLPLYTPKDVFLLRAIAGSEIQVLIASIVLENPGINSYEIFKVIHNLAVGNGTIKDPDITLDDVVNKSNSGISSSTIGNLVSHTNLFETQTQLSPTLRRDQMVTTYSVKPEQKELLQAIIGRLFSLSEEYDSLSSLFSRISGPADGITNRLNILHNLALMSKESKEGFSVRFTEFAKSTGISGASNIIDHLQNLNGLGLIGYEPDQKVGYGINENAKSNERRFKEVKTKIVDFLSKNPRRFFTWREIQESLGLDVKDETISTYLSDLTKEGVLVEKIPVISVTKDQAGKLQEIAEILSMVVDPNNHKDLISIGVEKYNAFIQNHQAVQDYILKASLASRLAESRIAYMVEQITASKSLPIEEDIRNFSNSGGALLYNEESDAVRLVIAGTEEYESILKQLDPATGDFLRTAKGMQVYRVRQQNGRIINIFFVGKNILAPAFRNEKQLHQNPRYADQFIKALNLYIEKMSKDKNLASGTISLKTIFP